ncbi:MAG TPA: TetR family transcriptional regulator [Nocardiopsis listeri]|uniref:acyl-CoA-like ligand-binding transcription factor n=1 Tax=Nocardiopsis listeri TaxID=53440 RepID=UPI001D49A2D8|nr:TetR family transcriptional regulator [Nocardiopsis listeri]HJE59963.1 TetR family transcriptional regulator [Nocardiopsis listeri]
MGLREQKKAATRAEIGRQALRLIGEHGYGATTTEQIAAAANVSPSTFFRYFPTKAEAVLVEDVFPRVLVRFMAQPEGLPITEALRNGIREVYDRMEEAEREQDRERRRLLFSVPELRATLMDRYTAGIEELCEAAAARTGRGRNEPRVRVWAGAIIGALTSVSAGLVETGNDGVEFAARLDEAVGLLREGLPL